MQSTSSLLGRIAAVQVQNHKLLNTPQLMHWTPFSVMSTARRAGVVFAGKYRVRDVSWAAAGC